ncbi:MAG: hypothetical protein L6R48_20810 [Planctomycetes bacterium]|nr:hypothetical protein [Planctomycetota bacterium]
MHTFTDALGRSWSLEITVATLKRVRAVAGVDLIEAAGGTLLDRLVADPVLLGDVLYACVKPQADERKITDEDFGRSLAGDAIDLATTALLEEFVAFFPKPRRRVLEQALAKLAGWRAAALSAAEERLNDPALDAAVLAALRQPGRSSGSAPGSAGSTPPG